MKDYADSLLVPNSFIEIDNQEKLPNISAVQEALIQKFEKEALSTASVQILTTWTRKP